MPHPIIKSHSSEEIALSVLFTWSELAYAKEKELMDSFAKGKVTLLGLTGIYWNDENFEIKYILESGQHIMDTFPIGQWLEWYEKNK